MNIKSIKRLKNFGIFLDYTNTKANDFLKYNLFYGWNGSGKSTISNLLRSLESKKAPIAYPDSEFCILDGVNQEINNKNIENSNLNIRVFNNDFINENISWDSLIKSILLIDKEKIAEHKNLDDLKKEQKLREDDYNKKYIALNSIESSISKFQSNSARIIKSSLQSIDTKDRHYFNYDKRKFYEFIEKNKEATKNDASILCESELIKTTNAAKPDEKNTIDFSASLISPERLETAHKKLENLLHEHVVSQAIQRLNDNNDIRAWVESGLSIHKHHQTDRCEFCGNTITDTRISQLEAHFNDAYLKIKERLEKAEIWLTNEKIQQTTFPAPSELYRELTDDYTKEKTLLIAATEKINEAISGWHNQLKEKTSNPLNNALSIPPIDISLIENYNNSAKSINTTITKHNSKSNNFQKETEKLKKKLELHYATTEIKHFRYHERICDFNELKNRIKELKIEIETKGKEIKAIDDSLANEGLGAKKLNESLHKFLGRDELSLHFNPSQKGYELLRNNKNVKNGYLSEGEKTAIAFIYFITKLTENNNKIEDTIIVVDDPVSSFDSNHLFHAYSFLRCSCQNALQLFVLTHNFTYFKLIRDWFEGVNRGREHRTPQKLPNATFYTIESLPTSPRQSIIKDADSSLISYNSEYHYIFSKLYTYKDNQTLSRDDAFLTANLARKLLEAFFSFKFPKHRGNIAQLMSKALIGCSSTDETTKEKIYRFINKYSHNIVIEINEDSSENLLGESANVIKDIFSWIEEVDSTHYKEMIEVINT